MIACIHHIEKNVDVKKFVYDDIEFWPILRNMLVFECIKRNYSSSNSDRANFVVKKFKKIANFSKVFLKSIFEGFYDRKNKTKLEKSKYYFLTASITRCYIERKGFCDAFVSPLVEWAGKSDCHIDEYVPNGDYRLPRYEKSCFIQRYYYLTRIKNIFLKIDNNPKLAVSWEKEWQEITQKLLSFEYPTSITKNLILKRLVHTELLVDFFINRLKKIEPKLIFIADYYSPLGNALILAAKSLSIKTIDLQHGVQGKYHTAYTGFYNLPKKGWSTLPDYFWNWQQLDADQINSWGMGVHRGFNGGIIWHSYLENNKEIYTEFEERWKEIIGDNKKVVLVSFQPMDDNQSFIKNINELINKAAGKNYFWLLRLHPGMKSKLNYYKEIFKQKNANVQFATDAHLPLILKNTDVHITRLSSVIIEANMFGVPNLVERKTGFSYYKDYENVTFFDNDLEELLIAQLEKNKKEVTFKQQDSKKVWEKILKEKAI